MATKKDHDHTVPLHVRRDTILDNDPTYQRNAYALCRRVMSGKVDKRHFRALHHYLTLSALRRAGVNLRESERMVAA